MALRLAGPGVKARAKFLCLDCGIDTGKALEHYFLHDEVWLKIHNSQKGMLCIMCAEARLGRKLCPADFPAVTINNPKIAAMSDRLRKRITGE